jgi:hypothetical protein
MSVCATCQAGYIAEIEGAEGYCDDCYGALIFDTDESYEDDLTYEGDAR